MSNPKPRLFLIDNYDSFTYNLFQYLSELGAEVTVRRNDKFSLDELDALAPDGIVISPGPGTPSDSGLSPQVIERFGAQVPVLGVCLGHQTIGAVFGGQVVRAPSIFHGKVSDIHHDGKSVFAGLPNPFPATRYHSLVIAPESVPDCLEVTARTSDGVIMGVRHRELPIEGVQFHPESALTAEGKHLLQNFIDQVAEGPARSREGVPMGIREALIKVVERIDLTEEEASSAMQDIVAGTATPAQIGAFAVALRMKGESVPELAGLARVMQDAALRVETDGPVLDVVGTGGDGAGTFNISTTSAIVAAAAGAHIAKHHNRAISGTVGGADFLGAIGIVPDLPPAETAQCVREVGIGFMFAPGYHPAMANAGPVRREIGVRTVFNTLGPLTNPARAQHHLLGVAAADTAPKMAEALQLLGAIHSLVVHGNDGIDEITLTTTTEVYELRNGAVTHWTLNPTDYGYELVAPEALKGGDAAHNAELAHGIFGGEPSAFRDVVELNAGAALYAADVTASIEDGIALARKTIESGAAAKKLEQVIATSQRLKPAAL